MRALKASGRRAAGRQEACVLRYGGWGAPASCNREQACRLYIVLAELESIAELESGRYSTKYAQRGVALNNTGKAVQMYYICGARVPSCEMPENGFYIILR
eukprot:scaffold33574_cov157-Skeletonema_dohrnii-CCMP3373.AAC.2